MINVKTATVGLTYIPNLHVANEFRFGGTWNNSNGTFTPGNFGGATPLSLSDIPGLNTANANLFFYLNFGLRPVIRIVPRKIDQTQFNIVDSLAVTHGRHMLKFGVDWRQVRNDEPLPSVYEYPVFANQAQILNNAPSFISIFRFRGGSMAPVYQNFSSYVQDEWKATSRLSVSAGVRWDVNPAPYDANGNDPYTVNQITDWSTTTVAAHGSPLWATRWTNFAPRIGLAYQIHTAPRFETVLRGGGGLFYDTGNTLGTMGYWGLGVVGLKTYTGVSAPASESLVESTPLPSVDAPYQNTIYAFDPHLKLPRTMQWNLTLEQMLGSKQTLRVGYVGSAGRRLLLWQEYYPGNLGNTNFASDGSFGSAVELTTNGSSSNYSSMQAQFQSQPFHGLQSLISYTWSHSIDNASTSFQSYQVLKASSDFDVRSNLQAAISYNIPAKFENRIVSTVLGAWALDFRISARTALPVDVVGDSLLNKSTGSYMPLHPNRVAGQPLYLYTSSAPGGRKINYNAFEATTSLNGTAGRNIARGFDAVQADLALRRDFPLFRQAHLQFRAEAFNILNHPIYGDVYNDMTYGESLFGLVYDTQNTQLGGLNALYQTGGPRSMQLAMKVRF